MSTCWTASTRPVSSSDGRTSRTPITATPTAGGGGGPPDSGADWLFPQAVAAAMVPIRTGNDARARFSGGILRLYTERSSAWQARYSRARSAMVKSLTSPNLRAHRVLRADAQRNVAQLVAAADAEFREHGAGASLDDIARRAGVGIGTLYRHFPTRD